MTTPELEAIAEKLLRDLSEWHDRLSISREDIALAALQEAVELGRKDQIVREMPDAERAIRLEGMVDRLTEKAAEVPLLKADLARAREDTKRLDWLDEQRGIIGELDYDWNWLQVSYDTLREAIDAARAQKEKE
jgi:hypothetical protein